MFCIYISRFFICIQNDLFWLKWYKPLIVILGETVERFVPTQLGAAVLASSLGPDEGLKVFSELQRARQCFVLENELHIIYLVIKYFKFEG